MPKVGSKGELKSKLRVYMRIRSFTDLNVVHVWIIRRAEGGAESGLLYGVMLFQTAEALADLLGLEIEREVFPGGWRAWKEQEDADKPL